MGVETHSKPPLPAPTESSTFQTSGGSGEEGDLATDVSRRTDKTSYSIPEDGSPVTIPTKKRRESRSSDKEGELTRGSNRSQTSLLIEYFGGGEGIKRALQAERAGQGHAISCAQDQRHQRAYSSHRIQRQPQAFVHETNIAGPTFYGRKTSCVGKWRR